MAGTDVSSGVSGHGDSEEHRRTWQASVFGTVLGLARTAVLSLLAYLAAIATFWEFFRHSLDKMRQESPLVFWPSVVGPILLILLFFGLPAAVKAVRERGIYRINPNAAPVAPGYFRLSPYTAKDAAAYDRPDGLAGRALDWLKATEPPVPSVLYLSGASGVGKSSLVEAGLSAPLAAAGWTVVLVRGGGAPLAETVERLRIDPRLFDRPPASTDLHDLLTRAAKRLQVSAEKRLLVVLDQFEEFLILEAGEARQAYAAVLEQLDRQPIRFVHLLHVFRSDYREMLFALGLPELDRRSGFELPPLTRADAEAFLKAGPRQLDERGYKALFEGLNRVEDTPGLYRLITLNMVGHILNKQGASLAAHPGRLIAGYVRDCVTGGSARDYHRPVLATMITAEGTKMPVTLDEVAARSGLQRQQVAASLVKLEGDGLVRRLGEGRWEVSHDFLARQIGQILGRLRPPFVQRHGAALLAGLVVGWVGLTGLGYPYWQKLATEQALATMNGLGFAREPCDGVCFAWRGAPALDSLSGPFHDAARWLEVTSLDLSDSAITSLDGLQDLPLQTIDLSGTGITGLDGLQGLPLQWLDLSDTAITSLDGLQGLPLQRLDLGFTDITSLDGLQGLPLQTLGLNNTGITSLDGLQGLPLQTLGLRSTSVTSLDGLQGLPLKTLDLRATGITSLVGLQGLPLQTLDLAGTGITSLNGLQGPPLQTLDLSFTGITSLDGLQGLPLQRLDLYDTGITDLAPVAGIEGLVISGVSDEVMKTLKP